MKKRYPLVFVLLFISKLSFSQDLPIDPESKKITYTAVVDVAGVKKEDLYKRAKAWFVTSSDATKLALELEDPGTGKLLGKVNNPVKVNNPPLNNKFEVGSVIYTITVIVKDEKYKYTFTDFIHDSDGRNKVISCGALENRKTAAKAGFVTNDMPTNWQWNKIKEGTGETVLAQIEALKKVMAGGGKSETDF